MLTLTLMRQLVEVSSRFVSDLPDLKDHLAAVETSKTKTKANPEELSESWNCRHDHMREILDQEERNITTKCSLHMLLSLAECGVWRIHWHLTLLIVCVQRRLVIHFYFSSSTTAYFLFPFDLHVFLLSAWAVLQCQNAANFPQGWIAKSHKDATSSLDGTEGVGRDMGRGSKRLSVHLGLYFISLLRGIYFKNSFVIFQFVKFLYCLIV